MIAMFANIEKITIPSKVLEKTFEFLQHNGSEGNESHAIFVGTKSENTFTISNVWFPEQLVSPASYEVSEEEEFRINVELNNQKLTTIAQIHTHPGIAFHSEIDNKWPSIALPGSLSIVIPDFGFVDKENLELWEVFQYDGKGWRHMSKKEVNETFQILQ